MTTSEALALYDRSHQIESALYRLKLAEQSACHRIMAGCPNLAALKAELDKAMDWIRLEQEKAAEVLGAEGLPWP